MICETKIMKSVNWKKQTFYRLLIPNPWSAINWSSNIWP